MDVPEAASPFHGARTTAEVESSDEEDEEEEEVEGNEAAAAAAAAARGDGTGGRGAEADAGEERRVDEEDVQDVLDAGEILRRHQSATDH